MARLFTQTDIERAARVAAGRVTDDLIAQEQAVAAATAAVVEDSPAYFSEAEVVAILRFVLERDNVEGALASALRALRRD